MLSIEADDTLLRRYASQTTMARGRKLQEAGAVVELSFAAPVVTGEVSGGRSSLHRVTVACQKDGERWVPTDGHCTCQDAAEDGWCQHVVAVLLKARRSPAAVLKTASLAERIDELTESQAKNLLLELSRDARIRDLLKVRLPVRGVALERLADDARQHVFRVVQSFGRDAYGHAGEITDALRIELHTANELLSRGEAAAALSILVALVEAYLEIWAELDDSDGEASGFLDETAPLLVEAVLDANPSDAERLALLPRARRWDAEAGDYGVEGLDAVVSVLETGGEGIGAIHAEDAAELSPTEAMIAAAWLAVLGRRQSTEAYLSYSQQTGYHAFHAAELIRLGRIDQGLDYSRGRVLDPEGVLMVIDALAEQGAVEPAVSLGVDALAECAGPATALASRVGELAEALGDPKAAWAAHFRSFADYATPAKYTHLKGIAGAQWPERAESVWDVLREHAAVDVATQVFLAEGMVPDAIRACARSSWVGLETLKTVGEAAIAVQPQWVVDQLSSAALAIIEAGRSHQYRDAADLLALVRDAFRSQDNEAGWTAMKADLLTKHYRKYTLTPLLKAL